MTYLQCAECGVYFKASELEGGMCYRCRSKSNLEE